MTRVLSLFDGMSCGKIALERAGKEVSHYYASEIDRNAIICSTMNNPDIFQLGDVKKIQFEKGKLYYYNDDMQRGFCTGDINLLIGGSPCQGFSFAGKQLNFSDPRSILFFEFVRLVNEVKPKYFLLENVKMKKEWQDVISQHLFGVIPTAINSGLVSAQTRNRLYWVGVKQEDGTYKKHIVEQPKDLGIKFGDIREYGLDVMSEDRVASIQNRKAQQKPFNKIMNFDEKVPCLTARGFNQNHSGMIVVKEENGYRYLSRREGERCQTIPEGYTDCLSDRECSRVLGNGWTVDVIAHIFRGMDL